MKQFQTEPKQPSASPPKHTYLCGGRCQCLVRLNEFFLLPRQIVQHYLISSSNDFITLKNFSKKLFL